MSTPKIILKFKKRDGREASVFCDHIVFWEPSGSADASATLHLSNGESFVVVESCAQIERHIQQLSRGGF